MRIAIAGTVIQSKTTDNFKNGLFFIAPPFQLIEQSFTIRIYVSNMETLFQ